GCGTSPARQGRGSPSLALWAGNTIPLPAAVRQFQRFFLAFFQIELAATQDRQLADLEEVARAGNVQVRQAPAVQLIPNVLRVHAVHGEVQHDQAFTAALIRDAGYGTEALASMEDVVNLFLDFFEGNHFAADLGKALFAAGDSDKAVFVDLRQVAGDVPAV